MSRTQKLTPKQAWFVAEYLVDLNATQAGIRAGYSLKTADSIGLQLLRKTQVALAIQKAQEDRARRGLWLWPWLWRKSVSEW
ncbi:terminase small subunit [Aminithiophilus ramosus]|uniref:Terminase small subunit n=2 Tax=Synergistales TaxID=649776 RepID=A0A9Q7EYC6_9BACT|nr:terminase small subunit [Aminithiophilus ramosus]QVL36897.1 terminase small subunit [Synergistota bacterium]